ncbi:MAG: hypothetical protein ACOCP8_00350 [archaeon]
MKKKFLLLIFLILLNFNIHANELDNTKINIVINVAPMSKVNYSYNYDNGKLNYILNIKSNTNWKIELLFDNVDCEYYLINNHKYNLINNYIYGEYGNYEIKLVLNNYSELSTVMFTLDNL